MQTIGEQSQASLADCSIKASITVVRPRMDQQGSCRVVWKRPTERVRLRSLHLRCCGAYHPSCWLLLNGDHPAQSGHCKMAAACRQSSELAQWSHDRHTIRPALTGSSCSTGFAGHKVKKARRRRHEAARYESGFGGIYPRPSPPGLPGAGRAS